MQKVKTAYYELEGTHYEIGRQMAKLLGKKALMGEPGWKLSEEDYEQAIILFDRHCPGLLEELRGFADENGIQLRDNMYLWMSYLKPRCSSMALLPAHMTNGHTVIARNYEFGIEEEDFHVYRIAPEGKYAHLGGSLLEFGRSEGINECGLAISMSSCGFPVSNIPEMRPPALIGLEFYPVLRSVLENCKNVEEAIAMLQQMPIAYNLNLILADREQKLALYETMNGESAVQCGGGSREPTYLSATNHIVIPSFQDREGFAMRNSLIRYDKIQSFLSAPGQRSEQQLKNFLLTKYPEGMTAWYYQDWFGTVKSVFMDVTEGRFSICWGGREENGWEDFYVDQKSGNRTKEIWIETEIGQKEFFEVIPL